MKNFVAVTTLILFSSLALADSIDSAIETKTVENPTLQGAAFDTSLNPASICKLLGYPISLSKVSKADPNYSGNVWSSVEPDSLFMHKAPEYDAEIITQVTCARIQN
jgi:hypothetical protein